MKKHIRLNKYLMMTVLAFTFSACSDEFLEYTPQDQATVNNWYRNAGEISQATATLYGGVWWSYSDEFQWCAGDLIAGDMYHTWEGEGEFFRNSYTAGNQYIQAGWQGLFDVISYANLIIDDMPTIAGGNGVSAEAINSALGEARFFRGVAYFYLAEYWGDVPIIEKPAAKVAANDLAPKKNTVTSVYEFIRRDLVFAAENLSTSSADGRVTSWAAKGMLAKLHVTLGQRGSAADFDIAADYASDVYHNSGLTLASNYEDLFKVSNEHDPEVLWAIECINNGWGTGSSRQARFARHTAVTGDGTAWGDGKCPTVNFINNLVNNAEGKTDLRRRAIYMEQGDTYDYLATENGGYDYTIVYRDEETGDQLNGASPSLTAVKKHIIGNENDTGYTITNQDSPFNLYMLRLADVYLLLAEAELGNGDMLTGGDGLEALNAVRQRAGLDARGSATFEDIFNERRVEFGFEAQGFIDLKRRFYRNNGATLAYLNSQGRAARYMVASSDGNTQQAQENDPDNGYVLVYSVEDQTNPGTIPPDAYMGDWPANTGDDFDQDVKAFTAESMQLPIPSAEIIANPNLGPGEESVEYVFE